MLFIDRFKDIRSAGRTRASKCRRRIRTSRLFSVEPVEDRVLLATLQPVDPTSGIAAQIAFFGDSKNAFAKMGASNTASIHEDNLDNYYIPLNGQYYSDDASVFIQASATKFSAQVGASVQGGDPQPLTVSVGPAAGQTSSAVTYKIMPDANESDGEAVDLELTLSDAASGTSFAYQNWRENDVGNVDFSSTVTVTDDGETTSLSGPVASTDPASTNTGGQAVATVHAHIGDTLQVAFSFTASGTVGNKNYFTQAYLSPSLTGSSRLSLSLQAAAGITPTTPSWNVSAGGVDYGYTISGSNLANPTSVGFYWASGTSISTILSPAASPIPTQTAQGTYSGYLNPSAISAPPAGANYLLAVADPSHLVDAGDHVSSLTYNPEITITSKYDGNPPDDDAIGRFLAAPGAIADETITAQLSDSLAALRPSIAGYLGSSTVLVFQPQSSEDITFTSDSFDPGTLQGPDVPLKVEAFTTAGQSLDEADKTFDVQPVPAWILALKDSDKPTFTPDTTDDGGSYTFKGFLVDLGVPDGTAIPSNIQFAGGYTFGATVGFGVQIVAPMNTAIAPTATGYLGIKLTLNNSTLYKKDFQPSTSYNDGTFSGSLTASLSPTLDPETLEEPDGGMAVKLNVSGKALLANQQLYEGFSFFPEALLEAEYTVNADLNFTLTANAKVEYTPGTGFSLVGGGASNLSLGLAATLKGEVDLGWFVPNSGFLQSILRLLHLRDPALFPSANKLPALEWQNTLSGTLAEHALVKYCGDSDSRLPVVISFGGSLNAALQTQLVFSIGNTTIVGTPPFDVLPLLFPKLPVKWGN